MQDCLLRFSAQASNKVRAIFFTSYSYYLTISFHRLDISGLRIYGNVLSLHLLLIICCSHKARNGFHVLLHNKLLLFSLLEAIFCLSSFILKNTVDVQILFWFRSIPYTEIGKSITMDRVICLTIIKVILYWEIKTDNVHIT